MSKQNQQRGSSKATDSIGKDTSAHARGNAARRPRKKKPSNANSKPNVVQTAEDLSNINTNSDDYFNKYGQVPSAGMHSFMYALGDKLHLSTSGNGSIDFYQPGIMVFDVVNTPGVSSPNSPLQQLVKQLYTKVYAQQTAAKQIAGSDLYMYLLAMDEAYSVYAEFVRVYGLLLSFSPIDRYTPKVYVQALGYNYETLKNHMPEFENMLDNFANAMRVYFVPKDVALYDMHEQLFGNVYVDDQTSRAKMYAFRKHIYRKWQDIASDQGSSLKAVPMHSTELLDLAGMQAIIDDITESLFKSESVSFISALLGKVLNGEGYTLSKLNPLYETPIIYDQRRLDQIHNMFIAGQFKFNKVQDAYDIEQDISANAIICQPYVQMSAANTDRKQNVLVNIYSSGQIVDTAQNQPSPEDVVHMTLFKPTFRYDSSTQILWLDSVTADLVVDANVFGYDDRGGTSIKKAWLEYVMIADDNGISNINGIIDFNNAPCAYMIQSDGYVVKIWNMDNPSEFSKDSLELMNNVRNYSVMSFDVPYSK